LDGSYRGNDPEFRAEVEARYGLDQNIAVQFVDWTGQLGRGDLGRSIISGRSIANELKARLPATAELGGMALLISLAVGLPVGVVSAVRQDSVLDYGARGFAILMLSIPSFWFALMVIVYGFVLFGWTPPLRYHSPGEDLSANLQQLWVPAIIMGTGLAGGLMRFTRSAMLEVLRQDYVRTAHAKGLAPSSVMLRHALRNALIPIITIIGIQLPVLVGGTVILERIFSIPGMGNLLITAIVGRDYPVIQAIVLIAAAMVLLSNLLVDLLYPLVDPRITLE
jgi:peptide/nickel transport system permease protein